MPGTNNEVARKEEVKKIVENRRRKAELIREQQIKKRNTIIAIGVGILVVLILVMVLAKSCSSERRRQNFGNYCKADYNSGADYCSGNYYGRRVYVYY
ncbi:MAG: hypothetical protein ACLUR5_00270 [Eubacterium ventriosum]